MPPLESLDLWTTIGSLFTAAFTLALVITAVWAGRIAVGTLRQMKTDSIAQTRPYVYAHVVPSLGGTRAWDLILKNTGQSSAYQLEITVDAWPETDILTKSLEKLFNTPQTLPPDCAIRTFWFLGPSENRAASPVGFDQPTRLCVTYRGNPNDGPTYTDSFQLDVTALGMTPMGGAGIDLPLDATPHEKKMSEIVGAINNLRWGK